MTNSLGFICGASDALWGEHYVPLRRAVKYPLLSGASPGPRGRPRSSTERLELLCQLTPRDRLMGVLGNPNCPNLAWMEKLKVSDRIEAEKLIAPMWPCCSRFQRLPAKVRDFELVIDLEPGRAWRRIHRRCSPAPMR